MYKKCLGYFENILNVIVLFALGIYLCNLSISSLATYVRISDSVLDSVLLVFYFASVYKFIKAIFQKKIMYAFLFLVLFLVTLIGFNTTSYKFLLWLGVIPIALYDVKYEYVLTTWLISVGVCIFSGILASQIGIFANYVYASSERIRSSWGVCYPTDFASIILFLCLFLWCRNKKCSNYMFLIPVFFSLFIANEIASSNTSVMCSLVLMLFIILESLFSYLKQKNSKFENVEKVINPILLIVFIAFSVVTFLSVLCWKNQLPFGETVNKLMNNRVQLASSAVDNYGIHPFGSYFKMIGNGGGGSGSSNYNFIDNSYALMFIRYGWVFFFVVFVLWEFTVSQTIKAKNYKIALAMALIAFHSLSEHHFTELNYNILLAMPFVDFHVDSDVKVSRKNDIAFVVTIIIFACIFMNFGPSFLSYARTIAQVQGLKYASRMDQNIIVPILLFLVFLFCMCFLSVYKILSAIFGNKKLDSVYICFVVLGLVVSVIVPNYKSVIFRNSQYDDFLNLMETEEEPVKLILKNKKGDVYSNDYPEYYHTYFKKISTSYLQGEELAKKKNVTVLTKVDDDLTTFQYKGFYWGKISDEHAIYTNDEHVIDALNNAGYSFSMNFTKSINTFTWGTMNGIVQDEQGRIYLSDGNSLSSGPATYLKPGNYAYTLNLSDLSATDTENPVAIVRVISSKERDVYLEQPIYASDFNENNECSLHFNVTIYKSMNVEVTLETVNGSAFLVKDLSYETVVD